MFESLIDNVDTNLWEEINDVTKKPDGFLEYHVNRKHHPIDAKTIQYLIAVEDGEPKNVLITDLVAKKDPLKNVSMIELKLNEDQTKIVGIDLNGDIIVRKGN